MKKDSSRSVRGSLICSVPQLRILAIVERSSVYTGQDAGARTEATRPVASKRSFC
jgi:hypothetical protein